MPRDEFEDVLRFWFGDDPVRVDANRLERWFRGGTDTEILRRFRPLHERACRGELDSWTRAPRSRLALILALDQFSRTLHRGHAEAFAQDAKAQALTLEGLENGHYAAIGSPWEKTFFFLPLGHSEDFERQELAVRLAEELAREATAEHRALLLHSVSQARGHRDVIARFGRHPHRNEALGRESTPEEREYIAKGEFVHTRSIPNE
jgi:uncharacterized protein (DUF924 family)